MSVLECVGLAFIVWCGIALLTAIACLLDKYCDGFHNFFHANYDDCDDCPAWADYEAYEATALRR